MKKTAAILLILIFAFNVVGYHLVSFYFLNKADVALENALNNNQYSNNDLISIKLPTRLPYYSNNKNFERIDGEVEVKGIKYKYVKYRIYNDSLEMLCIPNTQKMNIEISKNNYAKVVFGFQHDSKKKSNNGTNKNAQKNVDYIAKHDNLHNNNCIKISNSFLSFNNLFSATKFIKIVEQPPNFA